MCLNLKVYIVSLLFIFLITVAYADGSKDLYPAGVRGSRAMMEPHLLNQQNSTVAVFYNNARHFVYAKSGETLAVASSAVGMGNGAVRIISPSGVPHLYTGPQGRIVGSASRGLTNRQAELMGPRTGYDAYEWRVEEEGIWTIEFISPANNMNVNNAGPPDIRADANWNQGNGNYICAWDISVRNDSDTDWIKGRVFTNVLNFYINGGLMNSVDNGFFGVNYVLTKDGNVYKVDGNGYIGLRFTYFVNNSGFLNPDNSPSYKSSNAGYAARIHNPNNPDVDNQFVTHKIFYTFPSPDLPKTSHNIMGETWLLNDIFVPSVGNVTLGSSENTAQHVNTKGANISFETNYAGRYRATIRSKDLAYSFVQKDIIVQAVVGHNTVHWDGRDGEGKYLPPGKYEVEVSVAAIEGEVHFPYFDTEINPQGVILERVDRNGEVVGPAILYWDDSDIPQGTNYAEHSNPITNLLGISSYENGHRWGTYSVSTPGGGINNNFFTGSNSFGNNMAMDTWSYAVQIEEDTQREIIVDIADLEIVSVIADKDTIELNEPIKYTVTVKNNGPSDAVNARFEFNLPQGFIINSFNLRPTSCVTLRAQNINSHTLKAQIDAKNGCEFIFDLISRAQNVHDETYGDVEANAGIVRPAGYIDPDATAEGVDSSVPLSAAEECNPAGCNNIIINSRVFLLEPYNERGQVALLKEVRHIDSNNTGFQEEGEILEYRFTLRNIGEVPLRNFLFTDSLLNSIQEKVGDLVLQAGQEYSFTKQYTINSNDVIRKYVTNQAFIIGKNPRNFDVKDFSGSEYTNNDRTHIAIDKAPFYKIQLHVDNEGTGENKQFTRGDTIRFLYVIRHEGDIAVQQLRVQHNLLGTEPIIVLPEGLNNGEQRHYMNYVVTDEDILQGEIVTSATLLGVDAKYNNVMEDMSGSTYDLDEPLTIPLAKPPVAFEDNVTLFQSQDIELKILDNDVKGTSGWEKGSLEIIEGPSLGEVRIEGVRLYYKQHNNFESGGDSFTYRIIDNSRLSSNIARVHIEIIKTEPKAIADYYSQQYNGSVKLDLTKNDYVEYSEIDRESIHIISPPIYGQLTYEGDGIYTYTSEKTYSGIDKFTYMVQDKNGNWSQEAVVEIDVVGLVLPNIITPNGDGYNDTFEIIGMYKFERCEIQIFDRFKNSIYTNSNYKNDWQVSSAVRDGTYFYIIKLHHKDESKPLVIKGSLLIMRESIK